MNRRKPDGISGSVVIHGNFKKALFPAALFASGMNHLPSPRRTLDQRILEAEALLLSL